MFDALAFPEGDRDNGPGRPRVHEGVRGVASAWRAVASLALMCDPRDLRASLDVYAVDDAGDEPRRAPALYLYDAVPGGVGLAAEAFRRREELLGHARGGALAGADEPDDGGRGCGAAARGGVAGGSAG